MSTTLVMSFLGVCLLAYALPGADWLLVAKSAMRSRRAGMVAGLGILTGLLGHGLFALVGLSALLSATPMALTIVQLLGAAYLVFLGARGIMTFRGGEGMQVEAETAGSLLKTYRDCMVTNLLNPKAILFFVSVLPQFVTRDASIPMQIGVLTALDLALGAAWWVVFVLMVRRLVHALRSDSAVQKLHLTSSNCLVLVGVGLLGYTAVTGF